MWVTVGNKIYSSTYSVHTGNLLMRRSVTARAQVPRVRWRGRPGVTWQPLQLVQRPPAYRRDLREDRPLRARAPRQAGGWPQHYCALEVMRLSLNPPLPTSTLLCLQMFPSQPHSALSSLCPFLTPLSISLGPFLPPLSILLCNFRTPLSISLCTFLTALSISLSTFLTPFLFHCVLSSLLFHFTVYFRHCFPISLCPFLTPLTILMCPVRFS